MTILGELDGLVAPGPRRFNLDGAIAECTAAAATWATVSVARLLGIGTDDDLEEARSRLSCASAVLNWERGRAASMGIMPGLPWMPSPTPDYDDETIEALLRGVRG